MTKAFKKLLSLMRRHGHPVVWAVLFLTAYTAHDFYAKIPTVPFQPFCSPENGVDHLRPAKGVGMTQAFQYEVVKSLAKQGITMHVNFWKRNHKLTRSGNEMTSIWITPKDFEDTSSMMWTTREAVWRARGLDQRVNGKYIMEEHEIPLNCEDVEGKIKEF